jgi:hypothetical protein
LPGGGRAAIIPDRERQDIWKGTMKKHAEIFVCLLALSFASGASLFGQTHDTDHATAAAKAAATITVADLEARMGILGLEPGAGDSYLQMYPLNMLKPGAADKQGLQITGPDGAAAQLTYGDQFFPLPDRLTAQGSGALVRIESAETRIDASGKVAVIHVTPSNFRDVFSGNYREAVRSANPLATLVVLEVPMPMFEGMRSALSGERVTLGEAEEAGERPTVLALQDALPAELAESISAGTELTGWSAAVRVSSESQTVEAPNTVGVLRGSDPQLKDEYIVFSAHMDHVGVRGASDGDSIYNGADDNASGTVTVVELAQAFASLEQRPRRSLIFLTVSGEEKGLLGSRWYVEHPTFPLEQTVANINMDMVGRNWQDTIAVIGKEESNLGQRVEEIAARHAELNMAVIDDIWPDQNFYRRSDHFNFARNGVPILFFFNGTHEDYHRASDEPAKIEYEKMSRIGQLIFYLGLDIANADQRPEWDPAAYERVVDRSGG